MSSIESSTTTMSAVKHAVSLSVFFPCYNEEANVEPLARKTVGVLESLVADWEIILVDDGSKDRTGEIIDRLAAEDERIRAVHHKHNGGYGAALRSGFRKARKDLVFFTDGDGQFDIRELDLLLSRRDDADLVCGCRRKRQDKLIRKINAACWGFLVQRVLGFRCRDVDAAFKLLPRRLVQAMPLRSTGALISAELLARATRQGCTILDLPVTHLPRTAGQATGARLSVILRAFGELFKLRKDIVAGR